MNLNNLPLLPHNPINRIQLPPNTLKQHPRHNRRHRIPNLLLPVRAFEYMVPGETLQCRIFIDREASLAAWMPIPSTGCHSTRHDLVAVIRRLEFLGLETDGGSGGIKGEGGESVSDGYEGEEVRTVAVGCGGHGGEMFAGAGGYHY